MIKLATTIVTLLMYCQPTLAQQETLTLQSVSKPTAQLNRGGCPVYTFIGSGNWDEAGNWSDSLIPPPTLPPCFEIVIDPIGDTDCLLNIPFQMISSGGKITVAEGKRLVVPGKIELF